MEPFLGAYGYVYILFDHNFHHVFKLGSLEEALERILRYLCLDRDSQWQWSHVVQGQTLLQPS